MMLNILDGHNESRYPQIQNSQLINLIISNNCLIPSPGFKYFLKGEEGKEIRGAFYSKNLEAVFYVMDSNIYTLKEDVISRKASSVIPGTSYVKIIENSNNSILILSDGIVYLYDSFSGQVSILDVSSKIIIDMTIMDE